jgi:hypothetical protein
LSREVAGRIVVGDRAQPGTRRLERLFEAAGEERAAEALGEGGLQAPLRNGSVAGSGAPNDPEARSISAPVDIGLVDAASVVPDDRQISLRGGLVDSPREEIRRDVGVAGVRLAEVHHDVVLDARCLPDMVAASVIVAHRVDLGEHLDGLGGADLLQLLEVGPGEVLEVVVARHPDEQRPLTLWLGHSFLLSGRGGGNPVTG